MSYRVLVCERATGYVCHPDGRRYLDAHGTVPESLFDTWPEAEAWCRSVLARRSDLECVVYDSDSLTIRVVTIRHDGTLDVRVA